MKVIDLSYPMYIGLMGTDKAPHQLMNLVTHRTVEENGEKTMTMSFGNFFNRSRCLPS